MKWGGAVVTVLLVGVWIGSGWCAFVCPLGPRHVLAVERGTLALRGFSADHAFKFGFTLQEGPAVTDVYTSHDTSLPCVTARRSR